LLPAIASWKKLGGSDNSAARTPSPSSRHSSLETEPVKVGT
jgi:hypothetical protein